MEHLGGKMVWIFLALIIFPGENLVHSRRAKGDSRQKRLFSLFNIVKFKNGPCPIQSAGATTGTCLSVSDCSRAQGVADGNCAAGFGVCCLFVITGCNGNVNQNCTYLRNTGFPAMDTSTGRVCVFNLNRIDTDICQIRLDFDTLTNFPIIGPNAGQCGNTGDSLNVMSPHSTSANAFPPTVCGTLTGQHMYFESGRMGTSAGSVSIGQGTGVGDRRYNIKVTYIHCNSLARAPSGCTQYFTGCSDTISSYNHAGGQLLENQQYGTCIRQNEGYCQAEYSESSVTTPDPFRLSNLLPVTDNCQLTNHVTIPSSTNRVVVANTSPTSDEVGVVPSMRCGQTFGGLSGTNVPSNLRSLENTPFVVNLRSASGNGNALTGIVGFNLEYTQIPC